MQSSLWLFFALTAFPLSSCNTVALQESDVLHSYDDMTKAGGMLTKAKLKIDAGSVLASRTVRIVPTTFSDGIAKRIDPKELAMLTNAVDRALCVGLSERFQVVSSSEIADLTVHATVTNLVPTGKTAATVSTVASLGASAVQIPIPRIPIGLGGLAVEAEATNLKGAQMAAMVWSRGADMLTTKARISEIGDAYSLSSAFGADFSRLLVTGKDPFKGLPRIPSGQKIKTSLGGAAKYEACRAFGPAPGITGMIGGQLGLPPNWTDKGVVQPAGGKSK